MYMRKWTIRQFEWYRDNKILITVSSRKIACGGFFIYKETLLRFLLLYIKARQIKNDRAGILFDLSGSSE